MRLVLEDIVKLKGVKPPLVTLVFHSTMWAGVLASAFLIQLPVVVPENTVVNNFGV